MWRGEQTTQAYAKLIGLHSRSNRRLKSVQTGISKKQKKVREHHRRCSIFRRRKKKAIWEEIEVSSPYTNKVSKDKDVENKELPRKCRVGDGRGLQRGIGLLHCGLVP